MSSWQARLSSFAIRHTIKRQLAAAHDVAAIRAVFNRAGLYSVPAGVRISPAIVNEVPGEWVESGSGSKQVMLFLHGGGYVACTLKTHRPYSCFFAGCGFRVFMANYRLAPEHPFPTGLDDAVAAYRGLRSANPASTVVIAGDSAGGGLALATMLRLRADGDILPCAAALFSPLTDLTGVGNSRKTNDRKCAMFYGEQLARVTAYYVPGASTEALHDPLVSPVYGSYQGFPPLLIHVGEDETLLDDSLRLAERARQAGVVVDLKIWPTVAHDWPLLYRMVPEGRQSLEQASAFLLRHASLVTAASR